MLASIPFGELTPDLRAGLIEAVNVWPMADGYRPVRAFEGITPALSGILGGCAYVGSDGTAAVLGGTATDLYRYSGGAWSSVLDTLTAASWRFDQFRDLVVGVNGGAPVKFDLVGGTADELDGDPPVSDLVATVRNQVFLAGDPSDRSMLAISGFDDAEGWEAGTNQALFVPFANGGDIMGLCGGETGLILQKRSIRRATYNGDGVTWWQFDEIARDEGCMAKGSVAQAGQTVFYLSEQGFKACDRNTVVPIGQEKIDRTFFETYSRSDIEKISAAIDPRSTTVVWAMPGNPGRLWCYNWSLGRWTTIDVGNTGVFSGFTANISLDAIDALYPGGIDDLPFSLDSAILAGGNPLFLVIRHDGVVGTLSGDNLAARLATMPTMLAQGRRMRIRRAMPLCDATQGTVTLDARARAGDPPRPEISGAVRPNGSVPIRANGMAVGVRHAIPSQVWTYCRGCELEGELEGVR